MTAKKEEWRPVESKVMHALVIIAAGEECHAGICATALGCGHGPAGPDVGRCGGLGEEERE